MKILVAGDFCPQNRVAESFEQRLFQNVLGEIREISDKVDYSIVNFECSITKGGEEPIAKLGPNLQSPEIGMEAVKWTGFDCVALANNHIFDYGKEGVRNTIEACTKYGMDYVGGGMNLQEASQTLYISISDKTLAIINCCEHEFSIATEYTAGANPLNPVQQYYCIKEAKTKADYVLVIVHGGHEHYQLPSPRMQETYRFFVDVGADCVVNHHQHCFSGYEVYNGKPIFYGLGNFCFDNLNNDRTWNEGFMVILEFDHKISFEIVPYIQCGEGVKVHLLKKTAFDERLNELNEIISDSTKIKIETVKYYSSCADSYSNIFEPSNNKVYLALKSRGWLPSFISPKRKLRANNFIMCESHRDKLLFFLKSKCDNE